jgi:homoserine O-succinyltransferase
MPVQLKQEAGGEAITIGLVNNMPDAALQSTERQFLELLDAASVPVRLRLFSVPEVFRSDTARAHMRGPYSDIAALWASDVDGIIVTGAEPRADSLRDEPYWSSLTQVADWAEDQGISSVWSCLAAHAAVLHFDGIGRHPLVDKRFGLFECARVAAHPLLHGVAPRMQVPHSRWNELRETDLRACGYSVLTTSAEAGVDTFIRERNALALFFQGHPEYDEGALFREYRRDVGRYLRGERDTYPATPRFYFDAEAEEAFAAFRRRALAQRREDLFERFPAALAEGASTSRAASGAVRIYRNWLSHLAARKAKKLGLRTHLAPSEPRDTVSIEGP